MTDIPAPKHTRFFCLCCCQLKERFRQIKRGGFRPVICTDCIKDLYADVMAEEAELTSIPPKTAPPLSAYRGG